MESRNYEFKNWSKTFSCNPYLYFEPTSTEEIKKVNTVKDEYICQGYNYHEWAVLCCRHYIQSLKTDKKTYYGNKQQHITYLTYYRNKPSRFTNIEFEKLPFSHVELPEYAMQSLLVCLQLLILYHWN